MMKEQRKNYRFIAGIMAFLIVFYAGISAGGPTAAASESPSNDKRLAIIIDDVGNDMRGTAEILAMPVKLTVAVMPFCQQRRKMR